MPAPRKIEMLEDLKSVLAERKDFVLITYSGLTVEKLSELRSGIRAENGRVRVVKNNIFRRALKESEAHAGAADALDASLKGPVAVTFANGDFPAVSKVLVKYAKDFDQVEIKAGCLDGQALEQSEVTAIASLPSRDEMLGIIGRGLNAPATKIATGMNEIIASLARGIKAIGEKNG